MDLARCKDKKNERVLVSPSKAKTDRRLKKKVKNLETSNQEQLSMIQSLQEEVEKQAKLNKKLSKKLKKLSLVNSP